MRRYFNLETTLSFLKSPVFEFLCHSPAFSEEFLQIYLEKDISGRFFLSFDWLLFGQTLIVN